VYESEQSQRSKKQGPSGGSIFGQSAHTAALNAAPEAPIDLDDAYAGLYDLSPESSTDLGAARSLTPATLSLDGLYSLDVVTENAAGDSEFEAVIQGLGANCTSDGGEVAYDEVQTLEGGYDLTIHTTNGTDNSNDVDEEEEEQSFDVDTDEIDEDGEEEGERCFDVDTDEIDEEGEEEEEQGFAVHTNDIDEDGEEEEEQGFDGVTDDVDDGGEDEEEQGFDVDTDGIDDDGEEEEEQGFDVDVQTFRNRTSSNSKGTTKQEFGSGGIAF
jgi:hypothetical protein